MKIVHAYFLQLYNDPQLCSFFAGFKSTLLCLDLLYINGKYDTIIQIDAEKRQSLWSNQSNFSKFIDVLVLGACYKLVRNSTNCNSSILIGIKFNH